MATKKMAKMKGKADMKSAEKMDMKKSKSKMPMSMGYTTKGKK